jgi:hypothetical protein
MSRHVPPRSCCSRRLCRAASRRKCRRRLCARHWSRAQHHHWGLCRLLCEAGLASNAGHGPGRFSRGHAVRVLRRDLHAERRDRPHGGWVGRGRVSLGHHPFFRRHAHHSAPGRAGAPGVQHQRHEPGHERQERGRDPHVTPSWGCRQQCGQQKERSRAGRPGGRQRRRPAH